MSGKVAAFRAYGPRPRNDQWSWSAISQTGEAVLVLWSDELNFRSRPVVYDLFGHPELAVWIDRPGNRERIEVLKHARSRCGGLFRVIIAVAEDTGAQTRKVRQAYPRPDLTMRLVDLDEATGEFRAELVAPPGRRDPVTPSSGSGRSPASAGR